jgi:hypothetical protein
MPRIFLGSEKQPLELLPAPDKHEQISHQRLTLKQWLAIWLETLLKSNQSQSLENPQPMLPPGCLWGDF